jgi:Ca-activated chloride channel family protein
MRTLAVAVVALCLFASYAHQVQIDTPTTPPLAGVVAGRVKDPRGAGLPGVRVELFRDGRGRYASVTDSKGEFRIEGVAAGTYVLRAVLAGFRTVTVPAVEVGERLVAPIVVTMPPAVEGEAARSQRERLPVAPTAAAVPAEAVGAVLQGRADHFFRYPTVPFNTEAYDRIEDNRFHRVTAEPLSTFSIDVDTASYSNVRRFLSEGRLPPADAVRTEELVNYFRFAYREPAGDAPFSVTTELAPCPWNPRHRLALIGLNAPRIRSERVPPRNLVFLLDVSGSMTPPNKLPLVKTAMKMLADTLRENDRVAIVVYAGASGLALPSTPGHHKAAIKHAIEELRAGGSTNGAAGIRLAYDTAAEHFIEGGINRVILATDGDFNVGVTSQGELTRLIEEQRRRGVFLSVLGVGTGNVKDSTMEKLADKGNGNYAYLDSLHEARRVLVAEAGATLVTVAKDVKIQVEFNPARVGAYRLIGYENRLLDREDFNDDTKDAGEIGAGHTVTALYEIVPPGEPMPGPDVDPLKYQDAPKAAAGSSANEVMTVKLRYKRPDEDRSQLIAVPVADRSGELTPNIGFAASVAGFGMLLRKSEHKGTATWPSILELARRFRGEDADGYRAEFIRLVELAAALDAPVDEDKPRR